MTNYDDFEFVTSVCLNYTECKTGRKKKPVYHFVYGSQLYETIFGIYGRFEGKKVKIGNEEAYLIKKISLKLLNYKGVINMGFSKKDPLIWHKDTDEIDNLYFIVQGASTTLDKKIIFKKPIQITNNFRVIFSRLVRPLPDFEGFLVSRNGSTAAAELKTKTPLKSLFDNEFNDRDGVDLYNRYLKPGMLTKLKLEPEFAGIRCNSSNVNLSF